MGAVLTLAALAVGVIILAQTGVLSPKNPTALAPSDVLARLNHRVGIDELPAGALPAASRAYRTQFGHGMDEDLPTYESQIEEWLISWKTGYQTGEAWAVGMVAP